ncbi:MAG: aminotransferase class I/II-fold pyridoxal phosphate-dependent enzyme [Ruthenibacterium lactatiformans]
MSGISISGARPQSWTTRPIICPRAWPHCCWRARRRSRGKTRGALRIWRRDRRSHASPNSAQTEAVMAEALGVQLAGPASYFGKLYEKPTIGDAAAGGAGDILRANRMLYAAGTLCMALLACARCGVPAAGAVTEGRERMELTHGGDWAGYAAQYGGMPLDFSANVSPLGLPQGVRQAVARALDGADRYPDPLCRALRKKLSGTLGVPPQSILCGNGAADLIFRLALAEKPKRALVTAPTFAEYEQALVVAGCTADRFFLREEEGFAVTEALLNALSRGWTYCFCVSRTTPRDAPRPARCFCAFRAVRRLRHTPCGGRVLQRISGRSCAHTLLGELERA